LYGEEVGGFPAVAGGEQTAYLVEALVGGEVAADGVLVAGREGILIGGDDHAGGRVEGGGHFVEGDVAVPLGVAGGAIGGDVAEVAAADGELAGGVIADVAVDVGIDEVGAGAGEAGEGGLKLGPVGGAVDVEERELEDAGLGGGPAEGEALVAFADEEGAVAGDPIDELDGALSLDGNQFALAAGLLDAALKEVAAGAVVDLLYIEVLHVVVEIGDAPGDAAVVADDDAGDARQSDARDVDAGSGEAGHVPDAGER